MSSQVPVVLVAVIIALFAAPVCTAQELRQPGVHLSIDAPAWLNESQIDTAVDQIRQIWGAAGVTVSSSGYGGSSRPQDARVSVRILTTPARQGATTGAMIVGIESALSRRQLNGVSYRDLPPSIRSRIVAQAVGRVVAHELGHYLLQSAVHSSKGLMRSDFTSAALGDQRIDAFLLGPSESALLRREVTTPALAQRPNATR
jgi:hypothetical protein